MKKNIAELNPDTPIHPASPASPPNSGDTLEVTGEHLPEDITSLFTPSFEGPNIDEEKTDRLRQGGSGRMFQHGTHSPFPLPHDSEAVNATPPSPSCCEKDPTKPCESETTTFRRPKPARHARRRENHIFTLEPPRKSTTTERRDFKSPMERLQPTRMRANVPRFGQSEGSSILHIPSGDTPLSR